MFDRDEQEISQIIENGLEAILSGTATLESVVGQYPQQAEVLRPELEGALWLVSQRQEVETRPGFVTASRKRVMERIKTEARSQGAKHSLFGFAWPKQNAFQWVMTVVALMLLMTGAGSLLTVSQSSLPGDGLYAVKRISENVSYTVTLSEVDRVQLSAQFADRRLDEARALIDKGEYNTAEVSLQDYELGIAQTLILLKQVQTKENQPVGVEQLAVTVKEGLVTNTEQLAIIAKRVPANANGKVNVGVQKALSVSKNGVVTANRVYEEIQEKKAAPPAAPADPTQTQPVIQPTSVPRNPTTAPTNSFRPVDTAVPNTPVPTNPPQNTAVPNPTAVPTSLPTATAVPLPTDTPTVQPTPTDLPIPTETPVPSVTPTDLPTAAPTDLPTDLPTNLPTIDQQSTAMPVVLPPTETPSQQPFSLPTVPTSSFPSSTPDGSAPGV